jgi:hypothetical protein
MLLPAVVEDLLQYVFVLDPDLLEHAVMNFAPAMACRITS